METPDWKDMPDGVTLAILSWEDVYIKACEEMRRNPTRKETLEMFDDMAHSMRNAIQDDMPVQLDALISEIVADALKSKPYSQDSMSQDELTSKKYCHECHEIQDTYWELNHCEKNPEGIDLFENHGNDETCEDGYCSPESTVVESEYITVQYIKEHAVFEKCESCHQYFDSAGPQVEMQYLEQCNNCNGTGIFETCAECSGPGCVYCTTEDGDQNMLSGKNCVMCNGTGKFDSTQTLCLQDKRVIVDVKSIVGAKLTQQTKAYIAEAFLNQNIADWEIDGVEIHNCYTLSVDSEMVPSKCDDDSIIVSITSGDKDCGCLHVYGWMK